MQANYLDDGAGGTRLIREAVSREPSSVRSTRASADVLGQVFSGDFPTWTVGLTFSYPLGNSTAEANLARARLERDQAGGAAAQQRARGGSRSPAGGASARAEPSADRNDKLGRELAEQRLDAEQKRFEVGMSTSFLVIQAQRDLAMARNNELQALLDYQLAVIAFETVAADLASARLSGSNASRRYPSKSGPAGERQRRIAPPVEDQVGDDRRRQRGQQHTVAKVAGRVDHAVET